MEINTFSLVFSIINLILLVVVILGVGVLIYKVFWGKKKAEKILAQERRTMKEKLRREVLAELEENK